MQSHGIPALNDDEIESFHFDANFVINLVVFQIHEDLAKNRYIIP